uniref:trafficking protein particle complex subunit 13 isoform X1 n=1 Tax=Myxine glutinosa TaxID=7769 RepID=UPI00359014D8
MARESLPGMSTAMISSFRKMDAAQQKMEHLLALKVMRLTRPSLNTTLPVSCEERDLAATFPSPAGTDNSAFVIGNDFFILGKMLTLPQNFGNIFLGETFSSYISVHNDSSQLVRDIAIKADLQTSSQRLNLSGGTSMPVHELPPSCCIDDVIHHEVKELGTHILVCAVSYTTQAGEKMYFRKFFKFQVLKPLEVKTKFYNAGDEFGAVSEEVFLEAQIQNITCSPMCMEHVSLEPSQMYSVIELNKAEAPYADRGNIYGKIRYLGPNETRQYLYRLQALPKALGRTGGVRGITAIGKLDIVWRTNLGERGRLQTSQLQRVAPGYGDVHLQLESIPDTVDIEAPFSVHCKVTNCSERTMGLHLELCNSHAVHWCGVSGRDLGTLPANGSLPVNLSLLACVPGLQSISGLRLTDTFLKRTYEFDDITQVLVKSDFDNASTEALKR